MHYVTNHGLIQARIQLLAKGEVVKIMENNVFWFFLLQAANVSDRMPRKRVPQPIRMSFIGGQDYVPRYLCSPVHMFPEPMFPGTYVPRYLCSPVPMFPGTDVPRTYVPRYLCSPVPMFPGTYVPRTYVPRYLCSPIYCKCVVGPMYVGLVIGIGIVGPQNVKT